MAGVVHNPSSTALMQPLLSCIVRSVPVSGFVKTAKSPGRGLAGSLAAPPAQQRQQYRTESVAMRPAHGTQRRPPAAHTVTTIKPKPKPVDNRGTPYWPRTIEWRAPKAAPPPAPAPAARTGGGALFGGYPHGGEMFGYRPPPVHPRAAQWSDQPQIPLYSAEPGSDGQPAQKATGEMISERELYNYMWSHPHVMASVPGAARSRAAVEAYVRDAGIPEDQQEAAVDLLYNPPTPISVPGYKGQVFWGGTGVHSPFANETGRRILASRKLPWHWGDHIERGLKIDTGDPKFQQFWTTPETWDKFANPMIAADAFARQQVARGELNELAQMRNADKALRADLPPWLNTQGGIMTPDIRNLAHSGLAQAAGFALSGPNGRVTSWVPQAMPEDTQFSRERLSRGLDAVGTTLAHGFGAELMAPLALSDKLRTGKATGGYASAMANGIFAAPNHFFGLNIGGGQDVDMPGWQLELPLVNRGRGARIVGAEPPNLRYWPQGDGRSSFAQHGAGEMYNRSMKAEGPIGRAATRGLGDVLMAADVAGSWGGVPKTGIGGTLMLADMYGERKQLMENEAKYLRDLAEAEQQNSLQDPLQEATNAQYANYQSPEARGTAHGASGLRFGRYMRELELAEQARAAQAARLAQTAPAASQPAFDAWDLSIDVGANSPLRQAPDAGGAVVQ